MLESYLQTALRNLLRYKSYTLISILSLIIGITCFIFLMVYVKYEVTYDSFHEKSDRIYQVGQNITKGDFLGYKKSTYMPGAFAAGVKREFPEVEYAVRVHKSESYIKFKDNGFLAKGLFADADFLSVFSFPVVSGDKRIALTKPGSIVLSEKLAEKLFGNENPLGKEVIIRSYGQLTVTSVVKTPPENSNLKFEYLLPFTTLTTRQKNIDDNWSQVNYQTYIQLRENVDARNFEKKLYTLVEKYHEPSFKERDYFLLPMTEIHTSSFILSQDIGSIDRNDIYLLSTIAVIVLIIGTVNYMNLTTARAGTRNKEVGIRKTVGASRSQLMKQFLSESILLTLISIILSLLVVGVTFPLFGKIAGNGINLEALYDWTCLAGGVTVLLFVGLVAGCYPALVLSSLKPVTIFKKTFNGNLTTRQLLFRNALVVFQFCITIVLVIGAVIVQKQLHFVKNSDIGYERENVISVAMMNKETRLNYSLIKNELIKNPNIISVAGASVEPITPRNIGPAQIENEKGELVSVVGMTSRHDVDREYFELFGIKMIDGRGFSEWIPEGSVREVVINETTAKMAGIKNPVGKKLIREEIEMKIVGVVKDFHFASMKKKIDPIILTYSPENFNVMLIKTSGRFQNEVIEAIDASFKKFSTGFVLNYSFLDDLYDKLYKKETNLGTIVLCFSIITIILASIGLYGLVSFIIERKTKEIGIRKILGASSVQMIWLIIKDFFLLLIIALFISLPFAYYISAEWLKEFAYHINMNIWLYGFSIFMILAVSFLSIGGETLKASLANPVDSLKNE